MTDTHYKITMDGSLAPGVTLAFAQENFARLFKTDVSAVKRLFSGSPTIIKRGINEAEADKYVQALFNAGVVARKELDLVASLTLESIESEQSVEENGEQRMTCPKCDTTQAHSEICDNCGIVIAKFNHYQAQAKQAISTAAASPYASPTAIITEDDDEVGELNIWGIEGRIGRMRYVAWSMVYTLAMIPVVLICVLVFNMSTWLGGLLAVVASIGVMIVGIQIIVKRFHDIGWSGWLLLITLIPLLLLIFFIPFIGSIFQLLLCVMPGSQGSNRFGAPPPENSQAVKILFWIGVAFMVIPVVGVIATGMLGVLLNA